MTKWSLIDKLIEYKWNLLLYFVSLNCYTFYWFSSNIINNTGRGIIALVEFHHHRGWKNRRLTIHVYIRYIRDNCPDRREFHEFVIGTRILRFPCGWIATKQSTTRNRLEFYVKLSQFDASRSRTILGLKRWMERRVNNVTSKVSWIF